MTAHTRPTAEQIVFRSPTTGEHNLHDYLEAAQIAGRTLTEMLDSLIGSSGEPRAYEFRTDNTGYFQYRVGTGPWTNLYDLAAATSAATAQAALAATSATAASTSAGTATTQATLATAARVAAEAARDLSQDWAAKTGSAVAGGEFSSKHHAQAAAASATAAGTSATSAATSATAASTSAATASTALATFQDIYSYGPTNPATGQTGDLFYNTTANTMLVRNSLGEWQSHAEIGERKVFLFTATASQTTFSGAATSGGTLAYTPGLIDVFLNGVRLPASDYTATTGNSVVLTSGATLNDVLEVLAHATFAVDVQDPNAFDLLLYIPDKPTSSMICARIAAPRAFALPVGFAGSVASAGTASTGTATFTVQKGTTAIGSVTFTASAAGTFTSASGASFAAGDVLRIIAPGTADATLSDVSISFMGSRT